MPVQRLRETLLQRGYHEVITYSFVDAQRQQTLLERPGIALANPVSAEMAAMRASLLPGLIDTLSFNLNRQQSRVRIFETGLRFIPQATEIKQEPMISGLISGALYPEQWDAPNRAADFYDLKGDVDALLALGGRTEDIEVCAEPHPALHPGQSAKIRLADQDVGWLGLLHPSAVKRLDLAQGALVFELALEPLLEKRMSQLRSISRFPEIRRDLAVVVPEEVTSAELLACARQAAPPIVRAVHVFDVYRGSGLDFGTKSIALGLILQEYSRTLTDDDVARAVADVQAGLHEKLGATIRD